MIVAYYRNGSMPCALCTNLNIVLLSRLLTVIQYKQLPQYTVLYLVPFGGTHLRGRCDEGTEDIPVVGQARVDTGVNLLYFGICYQQPMKELYKSSVHGKRRIMW
jgi:hypothetical protein